jgi:hypothetical protein
MKSAGAHGLYRSLHYSYTLHILGDAVSVLGSGAVLRAGRMTCTWPDDVSRFFNLCNISSRTMALALALGWTQPLTEMSIRNLPGGKGRPAPKAHNLTALRESII